MLANMATSLIMHKRIKTTVAKAKALRVFVEPILTKSKEDTTHSRRIVFGYLQSKDAVTELFREISPKIMERPGGYTRILKIGNRVGDSADMCYIELVDYNENLLGTKTEAAGKAGRRRRRGSAKKKEEGAEIPKAKKTTEIEAPAEEEVNVAEETPVTEETPEETTAEAEAPAKEETPISEEASAEETTSETTTDNETQVDAEQETGEDITDEKTDSAEKDDTESEKKDDDTEKEKKE